MDPDLIEKIANVEIGGKRRRNYSFATKYCNFHRPNVYPIYDSLVVGVLNTLLRQGERSTAGPRRLDLAVGDRLTQHPRPYPHHAYTGAANYAYTYDNLGRLTQAADTTVADGCTTHTYGFNANTNRTVYNPATDGTCQTTTGTATSYAPGGGVTGNDRYVSQLSPRQEAAYQRALLGSEDTRSSIDPAQRPSVHLPDRRLHRQEHRSGPSRLGVTGWRSPRASAVRLAVDAGQCVQPSDRGESPGKGRSERWIG